MTIAVRETAYSPNDLLSLTDGERFELINGRLVERNMGMESVGIATQIIGLLWLFLRDNPSGHLFNAEASYACFPEDPNHARRPDGSFIRFGRLPREQRPKGHCPIPPDLAIEVVSPNDTAEAVSTKVAEFQSVGVPLIWVVYPASRRVLVHRLRSSPDQRISELTDADTISGEDVLPGFSCAIAEFFRTPSPPT